VVTLKTLKSKLDSSNVFYGVLRVVKMTSMAKFNEITKHAKVRDLSLRISIKYLNSSFLTISMYSYFGIMTNSGKCGSINVNVMDSIGSLITSTSSIITYGKKGYSLCNKFSGYINTIYEAGSTSSRNMLISTRLLSILGFIDTSYMILYNRYYGMTGRATSYHKVPSYCNFIDSIIDFSINQGVRKKLLNLEGIGILVNFYDFSYNSIILNSLFENDLSECSARIQSLETALKNLETIIEDLRKTYNKRRQGSITNELLEVIASTISM